MGRESDRKKILLVDDSNTVLTTGTLLLARYELLTAKDGQEGVAKALSERPDLILLDVVMPKLDGLAACKQLRQKLGDTPIIMLTTRGDPQSIEAGYESGCTEYLTKPFDGAELLARVRTFLGE